jgi:hypothetical protein
VGSGFPFTAGGTVIGFAVEGCAVQRVGICDAAGMQECRPEFSVRDFRKVLCLPRPAVSKINVSLALRLKVFTCMEFGIWEMRPGEFVRDYRVVVVGGSVINHDS